MNDNAKKWVAALRSGEYKQGKGRLRQGDCFCCLGVACDLYQKDVGDLEVKSDRVGVYSYDEETGILKKKVSAYFGLKHECPFLKGIDEEQSLANMNDAGTDFNTIADIIEQHQDTLFVAEICNPS